MKKIHYRSGYKYQLAQEYVFETGIKPREDIDIAFVKLNKEGTITIVAGYAWDGPSGPVIDTPRNMRASLVHDAFYQLMRERKLTQKEYRDKADRLFQKMCREDGVPSPVAQSYYLALKLCGKPASDPKNAKKVHTAPR